ncbi:hypothetical protein JZ751_006361 [Albula glossodonta]|uniref:Uncharacterized protein n=1 Tax=Albula glossodonta TaxID=121402 RepID=A0A8T2N8A9_9TELE|nr:hypothetical protein JZ751_006361 [Albula glossodonta]
MWGPFSAFTTALERVMHGSAVSKTTETDSSPLCEADLTSSPAGSLLAQSVGLDSYQEVLQCFRSQSFSSGVSDLTQAELVGSRRAPPHSQVLLKVSSC